MLNSPNRLFLFMSKLQDLAADYDYEIKTEQDQSLWPTYDKETGGLGKWLALYIREREGTKYGLPETPGTTEGA